MKAPILTILALMVLAMPYAAYSQTEADTDPRELKREPWRSAYENMSDAERAQMRERMRNKYNSMTPQEREAVREQMRRRLASMTPEERKAIRDRTRQRRNLDQARNEL